MISVKFSRNFFHASVPGPADTHSPNSDVTTNSSLSVAVKPEVYFVQGEIFSFGTSLPIFLYS